MRFHLVGLPFTNTTEDFPACAFTSKVRKFAQMMMAAASAGIGVAVMAGLQVVRCSVLRDRIVGPFRADSQPPHVRLMSKD